MPVTDSAAGRCPVCLWGKKIGSPVCPTCGWRKGRSGDLAEAQRRWDLRAAHLAAAGDESIVEKLAECARSDTRPTRSEIISVGNDLPAPVQDDPGTLAVMAELLSGLVIHEVQAVAFLCLHAEGIEVHTADVNQVGTTRITELSQQWHWFDLDHDLPDDVERRHFLLAGGIGTAPNDPQERLRDPAQVFEAIVRSLPDLHLPRGAAVVLINGAPGWTLLGKVAEFAKRRYKAAVLLHHPIAENSFPLIEGLVRQAPLGRSHDVVLLEAGPDGTVYVRPRTVLTVGESTGTTGAVEVYAPMGAKGEVTLALVVRDDEHRPSRWRMIHVATVAMPRGTSARIEVFLDAYGQPVLSAGTAVRRGGRSWMELLRAVPRRVPERRIDVVFAVERVEGPGGAERLDLLRKVTAALASEGHSSGWIRVGLAAYAQHDDGAGPLDAVERLDLTDPATASARAGELFLVRNGDDFGAALEDALAHTVAQRWHPEAERVLVTLGSRPPYTKEQLADHARPCVAGHSWEEQIALLDAGNVRRIAFWTDPAWNSVSPIDQPIVDRRDAAWTALGNATGTDPAAATVESLLEKIGVGSLTPDTPFPYAAASVPAPTPEHRRAA
jgi:hypothetical protein